MRIIPLIILMVDELLYRESQFGNSSANVEKVFKKRL
jgi:hypothetical protein